jgi:hypothetical protein
MGLRGEAVRIDLEPVIDEREPTIEDAIAGVTRMVVARGRELGDSMARIVFEVRTAISWAIEHELSPQDLEIQFGDGQSAYTTVGLYRLVFDRFGVDRSDLFSQERWYQAARRALDEALIEALTKRDECEGVAGHEPQGSP